MTVQFLISGRVQGVGFRWFAERAARRFGLEGFVENLPDGSVRVVARGSPAALAAIEAELNHGPRSAIVRRLDRREISDEIDLPNPFEIR
ncbi:MAG: acylphosphatase [Gemmatimonadota bacterium]